MTTTTLPQAFVWRRLHSLTGLWLVLFLMEHLLVNSQAALLLGENGKGFVEMVNSIHNLPYLQAIEIFLLGVPILIHMIWGVKYALKGKPNSYKTDGSKPSLPEYGRNRAYTWQRITSWVLLIGLIGHVAKFRFIDYPLSAPSGEGSSYFVRVTMDDGLYTVASRLGVKIYDSQNIAEEKKQLQQRRAEEALVEAATSLRQEEKLDYVKGVLPSPFNEQKSMILSSAQKYQQRVKWVETLEKRALSENQVIAVADNFGTASLLSVRDTFKSPIYVVLYTLFVLAACFHAFNGFWTFLITWGVILKMSAQKSMVTFAIGLMVMITCLGLASIWGTYWLNLRF